MKYAYARLPEDIKKSINMGMFQTAREIINRLLTKDIPQDLKERLEYEIERMERIRKDYNIPEDEARDILKKEIPGFNDSMFRDWVRKGYLDFIIIDGKKYFYRRFLWNLLFLCKEEPCIKIKEKKNRQREKMRASLREHIAQIESLNTEGYVLPRRVHVSMTVRLKPGCVPDGEIIRCWLPFPRENEQQRSVNLIRSTPREYILAPPDHPQRTIYFEQKASSDKPIEFKVEFEYTVYAFYARINPKDIKQYDEESELYQIYTKEQPPHIVFTRYIRDLAREIVGDEENPYLKAKKIYEWIIRNMTYTYVAEYSTYESICEYVSRNLRGDCGFHAILFITLCRAEGIPARWQSGWYANPIADGPSPHDWAQFYVEPFGWLYVDPSFGRGWLERDMRVSKFYFGNIDNFRTVFNTDIMTQFHPPKKYLRSDPVDNQRGELEWKKGNIYYDCFEYEIKYVREQNQH